MSRLSELLKQQFDNGNKWTAYIRGLLYTHIDDFHFFKTEEEALDYSVAHDNEFDEYRHEEIGPLYNVIEEAQKKYEGRQDIEFFWVDPPNDISVTLKINPDQNPLYNPEGNDFTDAVIDHWDKLSHLKSAIINRDHLTDQQNLVKHLGFGDGLKNELERNMLEDKSHFQVSVNTAFGEDKMLYILHFQSKENGSYSFHKYDATLQKEIEVEDVTVNGVNTKELESRMKTVNWNNDFNNKTDRKQFEFVQNIVTDLSKLDVRNKNYLKAKFWTDKPFGQHPLEKEIFDLIKRSNQYKQSVTVHGYDSINAKECYEILKQRAGS